MRADQARVRQLRYWLGIIGTLRYNAWEHQSRGF